MAGEQKSTGMFPGQLRYFAVGRKCTEVFMNTLRNSMKMRILALEIRGRKCVNIFEIILQIQKKLLPLHPIN